MEQKRRSDGVVIETSLPRVLRWPVAHSIVLVLFVVGSSFGWLAIRRLQSLPRETERTLRRHGAALALRSLMHELDGITRSYSATGDSILLYRFDDRGKQLRQLKQETETPDWPSAEYDGRNVGAAANSAVEWLDTYAVPAISLTTEGGRTLATDTLAAGERVFEAVDARLDRLVAAEEREIGEVSTSASRLSRFGLPTLVGATVVALVMVLVAVSMLEKVTARAVRRRTELALVLDAMPYGFLELDADLHVQRLSWRAAEILDVERRGLESVALTSLFMKDSREKVANHLRRLSGEERRVRDTVMGTSRVYDGAEIEAKVRRSDGEVRSVVLTGTPLPAPSEGIAVVLRDVTQEKLAQEQLQQNEKLATMGTLAAGVAHELNNPLAAIATFTHTIDVSRLSSDDADVIRTIADEARRAGGIVRNLLGFSRRRQPERKCVDLAAIVERVIDLRRYELDRSGVEIQVDCPEDLPNVFADEYQLQQVLLNLVVNAHQAMMDNRDGGHRLTVRMSGSVATGITVVVEDTGPGIPTHVLPRLFEPFFTTKPDGVGTGLGLSVSQGIVSEHEGRIWAENREEGGARFIIELPAMETSKEGTKPLVGYQIVDIGSRRILVVDDDAANRRALERVLSRLGHTVAVAENGLSALTKLREGTFEIVISDLHMPGMSGAELFHAVQTERPELAKRFLFLSGDTVSQESHAFLESAGCPALRKPYELDDLHQMLARVVTGSVRARASSAHWPGIT
ncbi:MAG: ATP-binding protein [Gemmatimonadales bacterium]